MAYIQFQLKKVVKSNISVITICLLLLISFIVLGLNASASKNNSFQSQAKDNLIMQNDAIKQMSNSLKHYKRNGEAYNLTQKSIQDTKKQRQDTLKLLQAFKISDWRTIYSYQLKAASLAKNIQEKNNSVNNDEKRALTKNVKFFEYLKRHPLPYEENPPVTGIQFLLNLNQMYLPFLFILVITFILTQLYTSKYKNKTDISSLLPITSNKKYALDSFVGISTTAIIFYSINLIVFIVAAGIFKIGSLAYPFYLYRNLQAATLNQYVPTSQVIVPIAILQILVGIFIVTFIQLISNLIREKFPSLFICLLLLIGLSLATTVIVPFQKAAAWLPTTYFNVIGIISGEVSVQYHNIQVNYITGILTLTTWIVIIYIVGLLISKMKR